MAGSSGSVCAQWSSGCSWGEPTPFKMKSGVVGPPNEGMKQTPWLASERRSLAPVFGVARRASGLPRIVFCVACVTPRRMWGCAAEHRYLALPGEP